MATSPKPDSTPRVTRLRKKGLPKAAAERIGGKQPAKEKGK